MKQNSMYVKMILVGGLACLGLIGCGQMGSGSSAPQPPASQSNAGQPSATAAQAMSYIGPALQIAKVSSSHMNAIYALSSAVGGAGSRPYSHTAAATPAPAMPTPAPSATPPALPDIAQVQAEIIAAIDANAAQIKAEVGANAPDVVKELQSSLTQLQSVEASAPAGQEQQFVQLGIAVVQELIKVLS